MMKQSESQPPYFSEMNTDENQSTGSGKKLYKDHNLQIVFSITLMAVLGVSSITPAFPKIARHLGITPQSIGLLITVFTLPGLLLTPVLGIMADRLGRKRILIPSLFLFGIMGTACAFARDFHILLILRFFQGVGAASLGSLNATLIGDLYSGNKRSTAMGYNASVLSVGTASYPSIGGALALLGWNYPFLLPAAAIPIGLLVLFGLKNPEPRLEQKLGEYLKNVWRSMNNRQVAGLFMASVITFIILYGSFLTYFPVLLDHSFAASSLIIGLIMSCMSVTTAITSSQLGRLTQKIRKENLLKIAFGLYAAGMLLFPFVHKLWVFILPTIIFGMGHGVNIPNILTLLSELSPMEYRGAFMSINGMVLRLGQTVGPLLMGLIYGLWGIGWTFLGGTILAVMMVLLVMVLIDSPARKQ